jgi:predicted RNA binding protein YcfA (HicA-like mRNA interferase family)
VSVRKATKARRLFAALDRLGWRVARRSGSHRTLVHAQRSPVTFAFHDKDEIGPAMLAKIAKKTGLRPEDL